MPRGNTYLIVYAEEEGGRLMARWGDQAEYEEIKARKSVVTGMTLFGAMLADVNYVALCKIDRDYDFTLGGPREAKKS